MRVTYNWLKDFVDITISPEALADKLTMAGLEVAAIEERDGDFVFEIEITSNRPDWLSVVGIAREIAAITKGRLKGGTSHKSPFDSAQGRQVTSKNEKLETRNGKRNLEIRIEDKKDCPLYTAKIIRDVRVGPAPDLMKKRLELIGCRSINNVVDITNYVLFTWGEPMHAFDLDKLVGPLSRYPVIPLTISVRRAKEGEEIITIDGLKRVLDENILVIATGKDARTGKPANRTTGQPIAIAGIMGGKDTEVTAATKNILLEAAVFNPITIRRARQALGVSTDSSYRFERAVAFETVEPASEQAVSLFNTLAGGNLILAKKSGAVQATNKVVNLNADNVVKILGVGIKLVQMKGILTRLGFKISPIDSKRSLGKKRKNTKKFGALKNIAAVTIPGFRPDVKLEIDLIEEIARIFGFENIPNSLPKLTPCIDMDDEKGPIAIIKNIAAGLGLNEVITYSLIDKGMLKGFESLSPVPIEILNPLSKEQEILRPTLVPSLLKCVAHNLNQKQDKVAIFEIADAFLHSSGAAAKEEPVLSIVLCGTKSLLLEQGAVKDRLGILHLKGIIETLFERLGVKEYNFQPTGAQNELSVCAADNKLGQMLILQDNILGEFGIKNKNVVAAEIYLNKVFGQMERKKKFIPLPVYPGISRDISLVVGEKIKVGDILLTIKEDAGDLLREVNVVDYYKGKQISSDSKGLTINCLYRSDERTLSDSEITPLHSSICEKLIGKFSAKIR